MFSGTDPKHSNKYSDEKSSNASIRLREKNAPKHKTGGKDASSTKSWTLKDGPITASTRRSAKGFKKKDTNWLRTSEAAAALGWSAKYLKRQREEKGGFLSPGIHFIYGPTLKSSIVWNVDLIRGAFHRRGVEARGAN